VPPARRCIRWCDDFSAHYELGKQVMPSVHRHMEIRHATAKACMSLTASGEVGPGPLPEGSEVVVKVRYKPGSFASRKSERAWRTHSELLLNLRACSNIVSIHDIWEDQAAYYIVMERAGGKDLHETVSSDGRLLVEEVKEVLRQLLHAVAELHAQNCIHKDIKLENVMFDRPASRPTTPTWGTSFGSIKAAVRNLPAAARGAPLQGPPPDAPSPAPRVQLIDFDTLQEWTPTSPQAVDVIGTDHYIAPEAYEGRYSPASDMFAVGVCAYKLITGSFPFRQKIFNDKPGENWVGSPQMRAICKRLHEQKLDWHHVVFKDDASAKCLVSRLLAVDDRCRPTAAEALADPWLVDSRAGGPRDGGPVRRPARALS